MKVETLESALHARPFRPFQLRVDGETLFVQHPEQVFLVEGKRTAILDLGERIHVVDVAEFTKRVFVRRKTGSAK